jgi:hypothetical protein
MSDLNQCGIACNAETNATPTNQRGTEDRTADKKIVKNTVYETDLANSAQWRRGAGLQSGGYISVWRDARASGRADASAPRHRSPTCLLRLNQSEQSSGLPVQSRTADVGRRQRLVRSTAAGQIDG